MASYYVSLSIKQTSVFTKWIAGSKEIRKKIAWRVWIKLQEAYSSKQIFYVYVQD